MVGAAVAAAAAYFFWPQLVASIGRLLREPKAAGKREEGKGLAAAAAPVTAARSSKRTCP